MGEAMKISTRGRYGVRLMLELAAHYGMGSVLLKNIAEQQHISEKYLWQLINPLKSAGLVRSIRGAKGGYVLAKPPADITMKDIMGVLEGSLCLVDCVDNPAACDRSRSCVTRDLWGEASQIFTSKLESVTLADMLEKQRMKGEFISPSDYSI
jgi:Rrf2 family protein